MCKMITEMSLKDCPIVTFMFIDSTHNSYITAMECKLITDMHL